MSRRHPAPAARTSGKRSKNVRSPTSPSARASAAPRQSAGRRKGEMPSGVWPFDVEAVRVAEHGRIPVGGGQIHQHQVAAGELAPRDFDVAPRHPRGQLHRRFQPQDLFDGVGPQLRASPQRVEVLGASNSMRIPLPSRLTVVSKPAASTSPAIV